MIRVNAYHGVVRRVSRDRSRITISAPRGGTFECQNAGFRIGQEVCYILDTLNKKVTQVLPRNVADLQVLMGLNPELQEALQVEPEPERIVIQDDPELMEDTNEFIPSERPEDEEYIDILCEGTGGEITNW